jgi:hypothetical protein
MIGTVTKAAFDDSVHTSENTLVRLMLSKTDKLSKRLIYQWGKDSDKFPLTFLTEGQEGKVSEHEVNSIEYTLDIMGRISNTDEIAYAEYAAGGTVGLGYAPFNIYMKTNKFTRDFGFIAADGSTTGRIMTEGQLVPGKGYKFVCELKATAPTQSLSTDLLQAGKIWVMTAPTIAEQLSRGNKTSVIGPAKLKNQLSFHRYTKAIAGNQANRVVDIEFEMDGGGTTNLWINEEMRQFDTIMYQMNEEELWNATYNRLADGSIVMKDYLSGEKIPSSAGVIEQVKSQNHDTYGEVLPLEKIQNMMSVVTDNSPDDGRLELVLYVGKGFEEDFDLAIKADARFNNFSLALGDQIISGTEGGLSYGNYFRQYRDIAGNTVTLKRLNMLDFGAVAEVQRLNGIVHPRTRRPLSSHSAILLDQSVYNGERNVKMAYLKGNREVMGVYRGLTVIPDSWGVVFELVPTLSGDIDKASYEKKFSKGVAIGNTQNCFYLSCEL